MPPTSAVPTVLLLVARVMSSALPAIIVAGFVAASGYAKTAFAVMPESVELAATMLIGDAPDELR